MLLKHPPAILELRAHIHQLLLSLKHYSLTPGEIEIMLPTDDLPQLYSILCYSCGLSSLVEPIHKPNHLPKREIIVICRVCKDLTNITHN
jgi:hypothetical protein